MVQNYCTNWLDFLLPLTLDLKHMLKKPIVWIISIVVLLLVGGIVVFARSQQRESKLEERETPREEEILPAIDPSVTISLTPREDKRAVILKVSNIPDDVTTLEYELTYEAKGGLPRGALGRIDLKGSLSVEREILLGTCSRNTCVYDEGVEKVSLTLRFNGTLGRRQFQKEYPL